jgi:flagellar hook protein FlgE
MLGFSKGLDVISNNIANLNTPGYKGSELSFRDLFYRYSVRAERTVASGRPWPDTAGTRTSFREGQLQDTGNPLDVAIDGNGFLVLSATTGNRSTARAGRSSTPAGATLRRTDCYSKPSGGHVAELRQRQPAGDIDLGGASALATTEIHISGNLSTGGTTADLTNVTVSAVRALARAVHVFTVDPADSAHWHVEARDENNQLLGTVTCAFRATAHRPTQP